MSEQCDSETRFLANSTNPDQTAAKKEALTAADLRMHVLSVILHCGINGKQTL